jgi:hypothetical protein
MKYPTIKTIGIVTLFLACLNLGGARSVSAAGAQDPKKTQKPATKPAPAPAQRPQAVPSNAHSQSRPRSSTPILLPNGTMPALPATPAFDPGDPQGSASDDVQAPDTDETETPEPDESSSLGSILAPGVQAT